MNADVESLSDREREALRLLGCGHEAKSIASALDLSVHTVNERLRAARRKLGVSSSREAARLLRAHEVGSEAPNNVGYEKIGVAPHSGATDAKRRLIFGVIGVIMFIVIISVLVTVLPGGNEEPVPSLNARTVMPMYPLPSLFAEADYPAQALAQGVHGSTGFRLQVSDIGRVDKCDIERSSGSAALDQATCRVITTRARFHPALKAGRPVASIHTGSINWMLREEPEAEAQDRP